MTDERNEKSPHSNLMAEISAVLEPLGYEVVHLEVHTHRQKILRIFIDHLQLKPGQDAIGVEDCAKVSRALDEPLDKMLSLEALFKGGSYELEVSSPGVDRPLRNRRDYERFNGKQARVHVYRPLSAEELGNSDYQSKHPKQKSFLGVLKGMRGETVLLALVKETGEKMPRKAKHKPKPAADENQEVSIPLSLICRANLEPVFDFEADDDEKAKPSSASASSQSRSSP